MSSRPPSRPHSGKAWSDDTTDPKSRSATGSTPIESIKSGNSGKRELVPTEEEKQPNKFIGCIRSLWATRLTEDINGDPIKYIRTTLRELVVYLIFLTVLCIISFGMVSPTMFYYTKVLSELLLDSGFDEAGTTFRGMGSMGDFWNFAEKAFLDGVYWEKWYNDANISKDELGFLMHENKLLGVPRMRMLQVKNNSCTVAPDFVGVITECYDSYSESEEERQPFGPWATSQLDAWRYRTADELGGSGHLGVLHYYSGGGFTQDLGTTREQTLVLLNEMKQDMWLTRGTRAVFFDFTVYNANINLFSFIRLFVEFPPSGGTITSWDFRTVKLLRYVQPVDYFILALEGLFVLYIIYYVIEESIEIKKHKLKYLKSFWNILDITVILLSFVCIIFNIYRSFAVSNKLEQLLQNPNLYADFEWLSFWQQNFNYCVAIVTFFAWTKLFKYLSFNKTMTQLSTTLSSSAKDLGGFAIMFFIVFFAFAQMGYLIFGSLIKDFSTILSATYTLFRIILGDFDFAQMEKADRILGPAYFMTYVFFVFFILLNMFLAIINDTYSEVKADMAARKDEFQLADFLKARVSNLMNKIKNRKQKNQNMRTALKNANVNQDKVIDFNEWRTDLKTRGLDDKEIDSMFKRYDADGDNMLDENEQNKIRADLEEDDRKLDEDYKKAEKRYEDLEEIQDDLDIEEDDTGPTSHSCLLLRDDFAELERRVDNMELSIGGIVDKIDIVLAKLEAMERAKAKRREAMANILSIISESDGTTDSQKKDNMEKLVRQELQNWETESTA